MANVLTVNQAAASNDPTGMHDTSAEAGIKHDVGGDNDTSNNTGAGAIKPLNDTVGTHDDARVI